MLALSLLLSFSALCVAHSKGKAYTRRSHLQVVGPETFYPASDPLVWSVGRFVQNSDGSKSFDWENSQLHINVVNASYVKLLVNATGEVMGRFLGQTDTWETTSFFVSSQLATTNEYLVAADLYTANSVRHIQVTSTLEPAFEGGGYFTYIGFKTDGVAVAPTPRARRIELVGDSISAGYGSRGSAATAGCHVDDITSGNAYTYNYQLAEAFDADITPIAWSGKGMYENCCDSGIKMPALYLQTLGVSPEAFPFDQPPPDAMIINLGTNDFGHDSGAAWEAAFTQTYVDFVQNATARYKTPKLPIFVAQGPMNNSANLFNALTAAITAINAAGGNAIFLDMRGPPNDGCGGHPGVLGHAGMFTMAKPQIAKVMGW